MQNKSECKHILQQQKNPKQKQKKVLFTKMPLWMEKKSRVKCKNISKSY